MVFDYNILSTWKTPDLVSRDGKLVNRTRVMGMSEKAAMIHIVALVCTAGISLPINLGFCIWHAHRYGEVKKERTWIRQILVTRNMSYLGPGNWVEVQPPPNRGSNRGQKPVQVQPPPNRGPNRGQKPVQVQPNPNRDPNRGDKVQVQPNPNRGRRVPVTRRQPANNDPRMQYAQANPNVSVNNDVQMQYVQSNPNVAVNNDVQMQYVNNDVQMQYVNNDVQMQYVQTNVSVDNSQQDFGNYADNDLHMDYVETNAYASVNDYEQDFGNYAADDPQMQCEQDIDYSAVNDLEQLDVGNSDALTEATTGLLELLAS